MTNPTEAPMANAIDDVKEWVLVPKVPTLEMKKAANKRVAVVTPDGTWALALDEAERAYTTMLSAAPPAPSQHTGWSDEAVEEMPDNLISHRASWLKALDRLIELEPESYQPDMDERGYWRHERQAMLDMYADLDARAALSAASSIAPATGFEVKADSPTVVIGYTNWRGEYAEREIVPKPKGGKP